MNLNTKLFLLSVLDGTGNPEADKLQKSLEDLLSKAYAWVIGLAVALTLIWAAYIGIKWATAKKNEQLVDAKKMLRNFIIGIVIIFILAVGAPVLISVLSNWQMKNSIAAIM